MGVSSMTDNHGQLSFERDIKPLFSAEDRRAMKFEFDLWDYGAVKGKAEAILEQLVLGQMPCYGAWPEERVEVFRRWTQRGMPA